MLFRVTGVFPANKGAALMLHAVRQEVGTWPGAPRLCADVHMGDAAWREEQGMQHLAWAYVRWPGLVGPALSALAGLLPEETRKARGIVTMPEVDAVLDASGFALSDQWGPGKAWRRALTFERAKAYGQRVVLLPQAAGPFAHPSVRAAATRAVQAADLVFAREERSHAFLAGLPGVNADRIHLAPDFTNLLEGDPPAYTEGAAPYACLIPNYRMMDKRPPGESEAYLDALVGAVDRLRQAGLEPWLLLHEQAKDGEVVEMVQERLREPAKVVAEDHPLRVKGVIGRSELVVSARFHGLVNALVQGVPSLAMGWSHKYPQLMQTYDSADYFVGLADGAGPVLERLDDLIQQRDVVAERVARVAEAEKTRTRAMWKAVRHVLDVA